jgi:hypothetical protein
MGPKVKKTANTKQVSHDQTVDLKVDEAKAAKARQLRELEQTLEQNWENNHIYEVDAPIDDLSKKKTKRKKKFL